ncbi:MAG: site-specific integrase [Dactylosporangium sp.]|nr:site-specific integrase [Dactylosporangium sp.]
MPLGEYLTRWLASRQDLAPLSRDKYEGAVRKHLLPTLGHVPLGELRPDHIQDLYDRLAGTSVPFTLHAILHPALNRARRLGMIPRDPLDGVIVTGRHAIRTDGNTIPRTWSWEQLALFLDTVREHAPDHYPILYVIAATGMRLREAIGLRWEDVDLAAKVVRVRKSKTAAGYRTITIDAETVALLREHWREQMARRERMRDGWHEEGVVFDRGDGTPLRARTVERVMDRIVRRAGLPRLTPHGLRHTHSSLLLADRRPMHYVQRRLGHASIMTTMRLYAHVIPQTDEEDAATFERGLRRARQQAGQRQDVAGGGVTET